MKKKDNRRYLRLQRRRYRKVFKRRRKKAEYKNPFSTTNRETQFRISHDDGQIRRFRIELEDFLERNGNSSKKPATKDLKIPKVFSLELDYNSSIDTLALVRKSLLGFIGNDFTIDFTECEKVDFSSLFLLKVLLEEYLKAFKRLQRRLLIYNAIPTIKINHSTNGDVNLKLLANRLVPHTVSDKNSFVPISSLNLITGSRSKSHYAENKKGTATTQIRNYIDAGINRHGFTLNATGVSALDGIISEILGNAEDHSLWNKWYAFANLFETNRSDFSSAIVGEINLAFLNFGDSIYEGFEGTKDENYFTYNQMERMYQNIHSHFRGRTFTRENLFTLYALQEGMSRLKFIEESRGTGTMKFIKSFMELGDYEDVEMGYRPHMLIFSGNTLIKCSKRYKPFKIDDVNYLSLNDSKNLKEPPDRSHLKSVDFKFPGTLLIVKMYLNEDHLVSKA